MISSNVVLTGATGILGSHVLYELLAEKCRGSFTGRIVVPARSKEQASALQRIEQLLLPEFTPDHLHGYSTRELLDHLEVIDCDLRDMSEAIREIKKKIDKAVVIHCGSSVNLGTDNEARDEIISNNYKATINLLAACIPITEKFVYISTAFASGHRKGEISDDFLGIRKNTFRNHYEAYKSAAEKEVVNICLRHGIEWQILRPSVICGRLVDSPRYFIPKYLVFYLVGDFFTKMVKRYTTLPKVRIMVSPESSLNIVPVDYAAKAVVQAITTDYSDQVNIVSEKNMPLEEMFTYMLKKTGYTNYEFVTSVPDDMNDVEKFYYKWIGSQLNQYIDTPKHHYNTKTLRLLSKIADPNARDHFPEIFDYAYGHGFKKNSF